MLSHARLSQARLSHARLSHARLSHAMLSQAMLSHARLSQARLSQDSVAQLSRFHSSPPSSEFFHVRRWPYIAGYSERAAGSETRKPRFAGAGVAARDAVYASARPAPAAAEEPAPNRRVEPLRSAFTWSGVNAGRC